MAAPQSLCRAAALSLLALAASAAHADRLQVAGAPRSWQAECASCHVAYPPGLLSAANWTRVMKGLNQHYGTDAALTEAEVKEIAAFLTAQASTRERHASTTHPPRITTTEWFVRKHRDLPRAVWADARVKTAAHCAACHTQAESGRYGEREIRVPGYEGRSW
jgi:nitrate/TMAO reductase-like tetraheme cytochrome c subunit